MLSLHVCTRLFEPLPVLGGYENEPKQVEAEKIKINSSVIREERTEENKTEDASVSFCSFCNVEMSQAKTQFKINGWEESSQKLNDDNSTRFGSEMLPVIVYLCPKCGKIDFRADEKLMKK